jgi:hypothetical protein
MVRYRYQTGQLAGSGDLSYHQNIIKKMCHGPNCQFQYGKFGQSFGKWLRHQKCMPNPKKGSLIFLIVGFLKKPQNRAKSAFLVENCTLAKNGDQF